MEEELNYMFYWLIIYFAVTKKTIQSIEVDMWTRNCEEVDDRKEISVKDI